MASAPSTLDRGRLFPYPLSRHCEYSASALHPEKVGSVLFSLLPLEFQTVLETGLAAYFELAHCPVELEREGKIHSVNMSSDFPALALWVISCWGTYFKENSLTFAASSFSTALL